MIPLLKESGLYYQSTNEGLLSECLAKNKIAFYVGFDCTAPSLHIGNLMLLMLARKLQKYHHKPIILIGGATSKIGDPSGRLKQRTLLDDEQVQKNILGIKRSIEKFIKLGNNSASSSIIVNNDDWLSELSYIDFLRQYGKTVSVSKMLNLEFIKTRISNNLHLSFLEFNYPLLQAYDFLHLHRCYDCLLQIGGSDQWGNIVAGVEIVKKVTSSNVFGLTTPLITKSDGTKMGKSANGAVWLNEDMLCAYEYFQYWRNIADQDVEKFARIYGEYDADQFVHLKSLIKKDINAAKQDLAFNVTQLCHGTKNAQDAQKSSLSIFCNSTNYNKNNDLLALPKIQISHQDIAPGIKIQKLLNKTHLSKSNLDSKRIIQSGVCVINKKQVIDSPVYIVTQQDFINNVLQISVGKKKHCLVVLDKN